MTGIEFEERDLHARVPDLAAGGAWTRVRLRWRRDPLTGASARILTGVKLQPATRPDLTGLTAKPAFCPFDSEHLEKATVPFPAELTAEGRIRVGRAVVVPNIMAYATHSAVGIYDPERHFLDLDELTPSLVGDALTAMVRHARAVRRLDPDAWWSSVNGNYLPPAGASLVHPHLQSAHDACGLTGQRLLAERTAAWQDRHGSSYWADLTGQEAGGPRWVGQTGRVAWLTPFAPTGFHEVWGVVDGAADVTDLTEQDTRDLGQGLSQVLAAYREQNLASWNFALTGGGPRAREHGYQVVLRVLSRSNPEPVYRSDATYFERLHGEALIDLSPEEVAGAVRARFLPCGRPGPPGMLADMKDLVRLLRRIAVSIVGTVILAVGVVLLVAPGPGLLVIALALAVFALEYRWARRRLADVQERARSAGRKAAASRVATACAVLFGVGAIGLGVALIVVDELPLSGAGTGAGVAVAGLTVLVTMAYSVWELRRARQAGPDEDGEDEPDGAS